MIYYARLNGETKQIKVEKRSDLYLVTIGEHVFSVDHRRLEGLGSLSLLVDSRCYEASVEEIEGARLVSISGEKFEIDLTDELAFLAGAPSVHHGHADEEVIKTPMPGMVVAVEVERGQQIQPGSAVVIVEAMKMQNEIASVTGGLVTEILVRAGDTVESNQKLAVVKRV